MDDLIQILLLLALTIVPSLLGGKNKKKKEAERRRREQARQTALLQEEERLRQAAPVQEPAFEFHQKPEAEEPVRPFDFNDIEEKTKRYEDMDAVELFREIINPESSLRNLARPKRETVPQPVVEPVEPRKVLFDEGSDGTLIEKARASEKERAVALNDASEKKRKKDPIDLKKLVVYSEIMKPKYDEY